MEQLFEVMSSFEADLAMAPLWVRIWLDFMGLVMLLSVPFSFVRKEARWVLLAFVAIQPLGLFAYQQWGYQKILGISHLLPWIPLSIYLWNIRGKWDVRETLSGKWLAVVFCTVVVSLAFDVTDIARYMLGHRM